MRDVARRSVVGACCFTLAAVLFTGQVWADYAYAGRPVSWTRAFGIALVDWELWTLLAPAVIMLAARAPLSRRRLAVPLAVHIPASLGIAAVKLAAEGMIVRTIIGPGRVPFSLLKIHLTLLTYWAIVAAVQYAEQSRRSRERELHAARLQTELARAQVEALKMQIHPHFLFNTLNAIAGLMREDVESADVMLAQLSELLRGTLQSEGVQEVPLAEELRLLRIYLAIQQTRYGDRLRVDVEVAAGCEAGLVPTLILQPLVENAIRHGFSVTPGPGAVGIRVSCAQGTLRIDVTDEGPGPPQPLREGYGLRNTRSRLRALYGDRTMLSVLPSTRYRSLGTGPDGTRGTCARLELPLRLVPSP